LLPITTLPEDVTPGQRLRVLPKEHREDADALQAAVLTVVYQALDEEG
jgi:hypothetical protein